MTRVYYVVLAKSAPGESWTIEFGDYDRRTCVLELLDLRKSWRCRFRILQTFDDQQAIERAVREFNATIA